MSRRTYLKMKIKSLAAEARIIRAEEHKWFQVKVTRSHVRIIGENEDGSPFERFETRVREISRRKRTPEQVEAGHRGEPHHLFWGLRRHRLHILRPEARNSLLAYGFLRGRPYVRMEAKTYQKPDWNAVESFAIRFSPEDPRVVKQRFAEWKAQADSELVLISKAA